MRRSLIALLLLPVLVLTACGDDAEVETGDDPGATDAGSTDGGDGDSTQIAISIEVGGGFVPYGYDFAAVPTVIQDNGTAFTGGAMTMIYPGPALAPVSTGVVPSDVVAALLDEAEEIGLATADELDTGEPGVTDTPTTTITVRVGGQRYEHGVYALGFGEQPGEGGGLSDDQIELRSSISAFVQHVNDAAGAAATEPYDAVAYDILPQPLADAGAVEDVTPNQLDWPLSFPLHEDGSCMRLEGDDAASFAALLPEATQITEWTDRSNGATFRITARAVIPGFERDC